MIRKNYPALDRPVSYFGIRADMLNPFLAGLIVSGGVSVLLLVIFGSTVAMSGAAVSVVSLYISLRAFQKRYPPFVLGKKISSLSLSGYITNRGRTYRGYDINCHSFLHPF